MACDIQSTVKYFQRSVLLRLLDWQIANNVVLWIGSAVRILATNKLPLRQLLRFCHTPRGEILTRRNDISPMRETHNSFAPAEQQHVTYVLTDVGMTEEFLKLSGMGKTKTIEHL